MVPRGSTPRSQMMPPATSLRWSVKEVGVGKGKKRKVILRDIAGQTEGGQLTALMGASGAGKTTLLECISLRNRNFKGAIHFNGKPTRGNYFTESALVYQKEVMPGFLTVKEHLIYHGLARMSDRFSREQIEERIEEVIHDIGLEKCRNTLIGGAGAAQNKKGLSGGERKRCSIATELLLCPSVIFLDEPTTSVDSVMAESIILLLRNLAARQGTIVMATVHSPSSQMFSHFTHLLLLTNDGRLAFHGTVPDALTHMSALGYPLPEAYNPADHFIKLVVTKPPKSDDNVEESIELVKASNYRLVTAFRQSPYLLQDIPPDDECMMRLAGVQGLHASSLALLKLNIWRGLLQTSRNSLAFWLYGLVMASIGGCFGVLYFQQGASNWRNFVGLLYALTVALLYMCPLATIMRTPLDWPMLLREYYAGANAAGPYLSAKVLYELPFAYGPMVLVTILYWMAGFEGTFASFMSFAGVVVLTCQASCAMALMVSSATSNAILGMAILPAFITPMVLFSGLLYDTANLPTYLAWAPKVSIVNYGFSSLITLQQELLPDALRAAALGFTNVNPDDLMSNLSILAVMTLVMYFITYCNLSLRLRFSRCA